MGFDWNSYTAAYKREHYERVAFEVPKGRRGALKKYAAERGISVNALIIAALEQYTDLDLSSKD